MTAVDGGGGRNLCCPQMLQATAQHGARLTGTQHITTRNINPARSRTSECAKQSPLQLPALPHPPPPNMNHQKKI
jgi:hypothetical protein